MNVPRAPQTDVIKPIRLQCSYFYSCCCCFSVLDDAWISSRCRIRFEWAFLPTNNLFMCVDCEHREIETSVLHIIIGCNRMCVNESELIESEKINIVQKRVSSLAEASSIYETIRTPILTLWATTSEFKSYDSPRYYSPRIRNRVHSFSALLLNVTSCHSK